MKVHRIYASEFGAKLDSDVMLGGGSDDTEALQRALDTAKANGGVHLVLDGAARISRSLRIYSNTTLECPNPACGLFLSDGSNTSLLHNAARDKALIRNENISLLGGTYNHNAPGQTHDVDPNAEEERDQYFKFVVAIEFVGVRNLKLRDIVIRDQRTFSGVFANWEHVAVENVRIDLVAHVNAENQDGLHFFGPGRFLNIRNLSGSSGDDFLALAPDELDLKSDITDVLVDGVHMQEADQGIRLLCCAEGRLDRVVIRNVTGTYRSFGFYINPWMEGDGGHYGNIVFDTVDLRPVAPNYDYRPPFLFHLGGKIECLTLRNIYNHRPMDGRRLVDVGGSYTRDLPAREDNPTHIDRLFVDGLFVDEASDEAREEVYVRVRARVEELHMRNVHVRRSGTTDGAFGALVRVYEQGSIRRLSLTEIDADGLETLVDAPEQAIEQLVER